jgi:SOS-response transcriptional repressor LexA
MYSTILRQITAVIPVDDMVKERRESTFALSLPDHSFHKSSIFLCCEATSD